MGVAACPGSTEVHHTETEPSPRSIASFSGTPCVPVSSRYFRLNNDAGTNAGSSGASTAGAIWII
jgi:hypothetical protein